MDNTVRGLNDEKPGFGRRGDFDKFGNAKPPEISDENTEYPMFVRCSASHHREKLAPLIQES